MPYRPECMKRPPHERTTFRRGTKCRRYLHNTLETHEDGSVSIMHATKGPRWFSTRSIRLFGLPRLLGLPDHDPRTGTFV